MSATQWKTSFLLVSATCVKCTTHQLVDAEGEEHTPVATVRKRQRERQREIERDTERKRDRDRERD